MQIGEQHLAAAQLLALDGERLLHLHDQVGAAVDGIGIRHDFGARGAVVGIGKTGARARRRLDQHLMAVVGEFAHGRRHDTDAVFVVLDFLRHADEHGGLFLLSLLLFPSPQGGGEFRYII